MIRTTLSMHESTFKALKRLARAEHRTLGETVTEVLNLGLGQKEKQAPAAERPASLPEFSMGKPLVSLEDKERLHQILDEPA